MKHTLFDQPAVRAQRKGRPDRILTIDIERLPGLARVFDQKTSFVSYRNFREQPRTICWAARWYGQSRVIFEAEWKDPQRMLDRAWELFDEADAVVTFNGDRFDIPHLQGAWAIAGYAPPSPYKSIDLYKSVKNRFGFISNGLDHTTRMLGYTGKTTHYSIDLAEAALNGDRQAQKELRTYNAGDIELSEWLYDRVAAWDHNHPHMGRSKEISCNRCGSQELTAERKPYAAVLLEYTLYRCDVCKGMVRGNWNTARKAITRGVR